MKKIIFSIILLLSSPAYAITSPELKQYYQIDNDAYAKVNDNALVAAAGLIAPADVKDSYEWGLKLIQRTPSITLDEYKAIPNQLPVPAAGKSDSLNCWLGKKENELGKQDSNKPCYDKQNLEKLIAENALFLERFRQLSQMQNYISTPPFTFWGAQGLISGEKLYLIKLTLDAEKDREAALKAWLANMKSVRSWNTGQSSLVHRSISLVTYGLVLRQLPAIMDNDNKIAAKYKNELAAVLAPLPAKDMNIGLAMKTDYQIMKDIFAKLGDYTVQKVYQLDQDYIYLAQLPANQFDAENKKIIEKYKEKLHPEISGDKGMEMLKNSQASGAAQELKNMVGDMLVNGISAATSMIGTMNVVDASTRMNNIYVQIRANNISKSKIGEFIKNAPPEMQDPFNGKAFNYDAKTNIVSSVCKAAQPANMKCSLNLD